MKELISFVCFIGIAGGTVRAETFCSAKTFDRWQGSLEALDRLPVSRSLDISDAPLLAIGKITHIPHSDGKAVCSATLITEGVILTAHHCLDSRSPGGLGGRFFVHSSGVAAEITKWHYDRAADVAVASLSGTLHRRATFGMRETGEPFPTEWRGSSWIVSGHSGAAAGSATLVTGCSITSDGGGWLKHDCAGLKLPGAPIFGKLCGDWVIVGVQTSPDSAYVTETGRIWPTLVRGLNEFGYGHLLTNAKNCARPDEYAVRYSPTDLDFPGRFSAAARRWESSRDMIEHRMLGKSYKGDLIDAQ